MQRHCGLQVRKSQSISLSGVRMAGAFVRYVVEKGRFKLGSDYWG